MPLRSRTWLNTSFIAAALMATLGTLALGSSAGFAQRPKTVQQAFAAVQAPEAAVETCHAQSAQAALDCARKRCARKSSRESCFAVTVCEPAGWNGVMGVQLAEVHFSLPMCGAPSREALMAAMRAYCFAHAGVRQCVVPNIWGPDTKLHAINETLTPADSAKK